MTQAVGQAAQLTAVGEKAHYSLAVWPVPTHLCAIALRVQPVLWRTQAVQAVQATKAAVGQCRKGSMMQQGSMLKAHLCEAALRVQAVLCKAQSAGKHDSCCIPIRQTSLQD